MLDTYSVDIAKIKEIKFDVEMYKIMNSMKEEYNLDSYDLATINNIALNWVKNIYIEYLKKSEKWTSVNDSFDKLENIKNKKPPFETQKEVSIPSSDFEAKMKKLQASREERALSTYLIAPAIARRSFSGRKLYHFLRPAW